MWQRRFSVNVQTLDLTTVTRDQQIDLHLTGTNFYQPQVEPQLEQAVDLWSQEVVSENRQIYRGEYLAFQIHQQIHAGKTKATSATVLKQTADETIEFVQQQMGPRYSEAYTKGVHDCDGAVILRALLEIEATSGLLRFSSPARSMANLCWQDFTPVDGLQSVEGLQ